MLVAALLRHLLLLYSTFIEQDFQLNLLSEFPRPPQSSPLSAGIFVLGLSLSHNAALSQTAQPVQTEPSNPQVILSDDAQQAIVDQLKDGTPIEAENEEGEKEEYQLIEREKLTAWQGWGFGVGVSLTQDFGGEDRIESVSLDENGIVRVDKETNSLARIGLETHYFGDCRFVLGDWLEGWLGEGDCGIGPFLAVQPGEDDIIDAIGFGAMIGFRKAPLNVLENDTFNNSFNIGIGAIVDPETTVLGTDVRENEALPDGETTVRTREEYQWGLLVLFSFAFN